MPTIRGLSLAGTALSSVSLSQSWYVGRIDQYDGFDIVVEVDEAGYDFGNHPGNTHHQLQEAPRRAKR